MKKLFTIILVFTAICGTAKTKIGENIDVTHYEIHINNLNFSYHTMEAVTVVTLTAKNDISSFDLELKSLTVSEVTSSDANVGGFTQNSDMLTINLATALAANTSASFTISYGGNTFNESWGGIMWSGNYVCNMGVGFESIPHNLGKAWFPCVDNFTDKATYDVFVTVPTATRAVCGGNLINDVDNQDGTHTVHYNVPQEIATYHISFVAGDYMEWSDTYNGIERDIPVNVYVKPSQYNKVEGTFVHVKDIAGYFENCFGPYPFNRIGYSITSVGCMEHVDNIGITSGVLTGNTDEESYVAHEMSHMWFGNKITCKRAEEMWLNEGFAQFCGMNYQEPLYGEAVYQAEMSATMEESIRNYDPGEGWLALNDVPQNLTYGNIVYKKGATIVHTLRNYLGKDLFNEAMRHYLNKHAYQAVSSEDLRDAITEYTGIDMTGFFDTYVFTCGEPHYVIDSVKTTPNGNSFNVDVYTSQTHRHSDHIGNGVILELAFMDQNWDIVTDTIHWDGRIGHTTKTIDFEPIAVFADYYDKCLNASTEKTLVLKADGTYSCTYLDVIVNDISDSTYLRIENHWVGPDHSLNLDPDYNFSTQRYWTVFRDDKGTATINGRFRYSRNYDDDIIHSENDSTFLWYREDASHPWHSIPYTFEGNWKLGRCTVSDMPSGDYTTVSIDKTVWGIGENTVKPTKINVMPNPASDFVKISTDADASELLIINSLGQNVDTFSVKGKKEITLTVSDYKSGVYHINLIDEKKNLISTEKLVKK